MRVSILLSTLLVLACALPVAWGQQAPAPQPAPAETYGILRVRAPFGLIFAQAIPDPAQWGFTGARPFHVSAPRMGLDRNKVELTGRLVKTGHDSFRLEGRCGYTTPMMVGKMWVWTTRWSNFSAPLVAGHANVAACGGTYVSARLPGQS